MTPQKRVYHTSSTLLKIETGFLWECLVNTWIITEKQLEVALKAQKEQHKSKPIWEILSELYSIPIEKIESTFVKEQLIFWVKRLVKDILHDDKLINVRIRNEQLPCIKKTFSEENIDVTIPHWKVNYKRSLYFRQDDWEIVSVQKPEYIIESIEWLLEIIITLNWESIFHDKKFTYYINDKKIDISSMELLGMIRCSFLTLYSNITKNQTG